MMIGISSKVYSRLMKGKSSKVYPANDGMSSKVYYMVMKGRNGKVYSKLIKGGSSKADER
jgi:hypothetical protein